MLWYVAIIGAINLGLGYFWGAYVRQCPRCAKARAMGLSLLSPSTPQEFAPRLKPAAEFSVEMPPLEHLTTSSSPATPASAEVDPELVTREQADGMLNELLADESDALPLTVALVELMPTDTGKTWNKAVDKRLIESVTNIVRQSLTSRHTVASFGEQQLLVLVPHEDVQQTTRRAEEMRQRVATTEFVVDGQTYQTTVTCALAAAADMSRSSQIYEILQEALDEAKRYGGNRTFMHDGKSPSPVVPVELHIAPQQLAI